MKQINNHQFNDICWNKGVVIMNTPNNKRKRESQGKIEKIFVQLIQDKEINEISITDICKKAKLNRSTFYANYLDVYDLADKIREKLELEVGTLYQEERETIILLTVKNN